MDKNTVLGSLAFLSLLFLQVGCGDQTDSRAQPEELLLRSSVKTLTGLQKIADKCGTRGSTRCKRFSFDCILQKENFTITKTDGSTLETKCVPHCGVAGSRELCGVLVNYCIYKSKSCQKRIGPKDYKVVLQGSVTSVPPRKPDEKVDLKSFCRGLKRTSCELHPIFCDLTDNGCVWRQSSGTVELREFCGKLSKKHCKSSSVCDSHDNGCLPNSFYGSEITVRDLCEERNGLSKTFCEEGNYCRYVDDRGEGYCLAHEGG